MRQGNEFSQYVDRNERDEIVLRLPLELEGDWADKRYVTWVDNRDGTYTLKPRTEL